MDLRSDLLFFGRGVDLILGLRPRQLTDMIVTQVPQQALTAGNVVLL